MADVEILKNKNGTVTYRLAYKDKLTNKWKYVSKNYEIDTVRNRKKAQRELEERIYNILTASEPDLATFEKVVESYKAYCSVALKASTTTRNLATINRILRAFPSGTILGRVPAAVWREKLMALSLHDGKVSPGTYNEYLTRLKTFLRWAYRADYISDLAFLDKLERLPDTSKHEKAADKYLESEEVRDLIKALEPYEQIALIVEFLALSGLRVGELQALERSDISDGFIHVSKTYDQRNHIVTSPKTSSSVRDVAIQKELAKCIEKINAYQKDLARLYQIASPLFMFGRHGGAFSYSYFRAVLEEVSAAALGFRVTPHMLRHTHASLLMQEGISIDAISRRLGHENSKVTREIYLHVTEKLKKKEAEQLLNLKIL